MRILFALVIMLFVFASDCLVPYLQMMLRLFRDRRGRERRTMKARMTGMKMTSPNFSVQCLFTSGPDLRTDPNHVDYDPARTCSNPPVPPPQKKGV